MIHDIFSRVYIFMYNCMCVRARVRIYLCAGVCVSIYARFNVHVNTLVCMDLSVYECFLFTRVFCVYALGLYVRTRARLRMHVWVCFFSFLYNCAYVAGRFVKIFRFHSLYLCTCGRACTICIYYSRAESRAAVLPLRER